MDISTFEEDGEERIRGNNDFRLKREAIIESKSLKSDYFRKKKKKKKKNSNTRLTKTSTSKKLYAKIFDKNFSGKIINSVMHNFVESLRPENEMKKVNKK